MMGVNIIARLLGLDEPQQKETKPEEPQEKVEKKVKRYPTYDEMERRIGEENGEE